MEYKWTALSVTTVGTLMAGIDARIVVIGLPTIAQQLHAGAEEVVWITQAYLLAATVGLLLIGRITDVFGRVKMYSAGFAIFTIGSIFAALSAASYQLIIFRMVQGVGAGIVVTSSAAIVTDASPKNELGTLLGINQTAFRIGNTVGLTLSGLILTLVDWRGLFYVNIPIGIFGTLWARRRLREVLAKDPSRKMDWAGFGLFSIGLTLMLLAVTFLSYGISGAAEGYAFLFTGLILLALFVRVELGAPSPMLDLRLFRIRAFVAGNLAQMLNALAWAGILLLTAFYLQIGLGYTPLHAGLAILPLDMTYLVFSLISGKLSDKYGTRGLSTLGLTINTFSFFAMSTFGAATQYQQVVLVLVAVGIGNGLFNPPNTRAIMGSVPANRRGVASGFRSTMYQVGATVSYGLVILFITLGIPYASFSLLLQGLEAQSLVAVAKMQFLDGFRIATLILASIDAIAILPSAMRGAKELEPPPVPGA